MKLQFSSRRRRRKKGDTSQLAAQLAPLEEQDKKSAAKQLASVPLVDPLVESGFTAIVVDSNDLSVPKDILEDGGEKTYFGMEPVVLVILAFMLIFIAFISWQISLMPVE